ncbi:MAG: MaoC family dehydratase N-terminal domain-containing protein [Parvularculaceae bacterium]
MANKYSDWIGREETREDVLDLARSGALAAFLSSEDVLSMGDILPPLFHWIYFWDPKTPEETGVDGHPRRGAFLPPVDTPRRMWASGKLRFPGDLRVGDSARRVSVIKDVSEKSGRSGALTFVTVGHTISVGGRTCVEEDQMLVYREPQSGEGAAATKPAAAELPTPDFSQEFHPEPVALFRYSALTLNSHRIHYDHPYATGVEGYPGLVVHGPLQATLLALLAKSATRKTLASFSFRAMAPAFCGEGISLNASHADAGVDLWAAQGGVKTVAAMAGLREGEAS